MINDLRGDLVLAPQRVNGNRENCDVERFQRSWGGSDQSASCEKFCQQVLKLIRHFIHLTKYEVTKWKILPN